MQTINKLEDVKFIDSKVIQSILDKNSTQFFTVTFIKKDGSLRTLNGILRDSPKSHINHKNLFTVETFKPASVRSVDKNKVLSITKSKMKIESSSLKAFK